ncbi:zinc ribbon domain-containing protein [Candidatus Bathyarchaeota archaeon]|nr:zinc ribbon domain-containing protein [Candidatus Bathyarchaeota archaeon]
MSLCRWLRRHGETVVLNCPNCKKRVRDEEANYCPYCGKLLLTEIPPPPTSARRKLPPIAAGLTTTAAFVLVVYAGLALQTFTLSYFSIGGETGYYPSNYAWLLISATFDLLAFPFGLIGSAAALRRRNMGLAVLGTIFPIISGFVTFISVGLVHGYWMNSGFLAFPIIALSATSTVLTIASRDEFS